MKISSDIAEPSLSAFPREGRVSRGRLRCGCVSLVSALGAVLATAQTPATSDPQAIAFDSRFRAAVVAYQEHRFPQAAEELEDLVRQDPKSFQVQELLGLTYGAQSMDSHAVDHLQIAVTLEPVSVVARTNLAIGFLREGKPQEAETQCRKSIELEPQGYDANRMLAELLLRENKITDALPQLEVAQRIRPDAYDNGYDLALAYLLSGQPSEARQRANLLLLQKDSGDVHALLGRINEKDGKYVEAANEFALAAHLDSSEDNLFIWASELLLHHTYEPAIMVFRQASQRYPTSPRLWIGLGMALYSLAEYEEAIGSLLTAADLNPTDPRCYLFLSKAYLSSPHQAQKAIDRFRRYAELEPRNALAQFYYAMSLWKGLRVDHPEVDYKAVEALLQRSIALDEHFADAHLQLGILYNNEHAYNKSFPEYQRALQLNPALAEAHFRLGRYYLQVGERSKAQSEFDVFKALQSKHLDELDRAEVQRFIVSANVDPTPGPR